MSCKFCKTKAVWKFTNQRQLCSVCFVKYFEKKVKSTIRKYNMPINKINKKDLKANVINYITKTLPERKGSLSLDSLNDISSKILYSMMYGNSEELKNFFPKNQPFYFLSDKEIGLYSKIKKIKGKIKEAKEKNKDKLKGINNFVQEIEKKNPDIRHNIMVALIRTKEFQTTNFIKLKNY